MFDTFTGEENRRIVALQKALEWANDRGLSLTAEGVVAAAKAFETYIKAGN